MFRSNIQYLAFDDRRLMLVGIPIITILLPFLFFGLSVPVYLKVARYEFFENLVYTSSYWFFNRHLLIWLRKKYNTFQDTLKRFGLQILFVALGVPMISVLVSLLIIFFYRNIGVSDPFNPTFLQSISATYFLSFSVVVLYEAIYFFHKYKEAIVEKEKIQQAHIQSQLDNLRNQINPHFLFNSLNTLMNLIPTNSDRAMAYLSKLARFYRYAVSNQEESLVLLQTEIDNISIYVDLLKGRFHNAIQIEIPYEVPSNYRILPLCLQLLIENAVKHNIVSNKNPLKIRIELREEEAYLEVINNIQKKIQEVHSTGMGLKNIKNRIAFFTQKPLVVLEEAGYFKVAVPLIHE